MPRPEVGSHPRVTEKRRISMIPSQKWGMESPKSAPSIEAMSQSDPRLTAERIPRGIEKSSAITMAAPASSRVAGNLSKIRVIAGTR